MADANVSTATNDGGNQEQSILVDIIIPVHNASSTIEEAVRSSMAQTIPQHLKSQLESYKLFINVCCYDDGSSDSSWEILQRLKNYFERDNEALKNQRVIVSRLLIQKSDDGNARGAGFARNKAVALSCSSATKVHLQFLCLLDSDDTMHPHRVAEQTCYMLELDADVRRRTLLGCNFVRDPPESTWHYSQWANSLGDDRLLLERFREVTVLQPTWFLCRQRFHDLGGYVEAPPECNTKEQISSFFDREEKVHRRLVHPRHDSLESLRLAEDLRMFHDHLDDNGIVRLHRTNEPLVTYRHTGTSQSFRTSRRLLLQLKVLAFERSILRLQPLWQNDGGSFVIWGAGRDGKEFYKALSEDLRSRVCCFVDVDDKKLRVGRYVNRDLKTDIPVVHFSFLVKDDFRRQHIQTAWEYGEISSALYGRIRKGKAISEANIRTHQDSDPPPKKLRHSQRRPLQSHGLDHVKLQRLPVVVCVAMYRTEGALERNVEAIGRQEGVDLWHFS